MIIFINSYLHKKENLFSQFSPVFPPIGIGYLASISLEKNINFKIFNQQIYHNIEKKIFNYLKSIKNNDNKNFLIFALSIVTPAFKASLKTAQFIRSNYKNAIIIAGGIHCTAAPYDLIKTELFDFIIQGEAEESFFELYESIINNKKNFDSIPGLIYKIDNKYVNSKVKFKLIDEKNIPLFPYHLFENEKRYDISVLLSSRGCKLNCIFCSNHIISKNIVRIYSIQKVLDHIEILILKYKKNHILFLDDNFLEDENRIIELCSSINSKGFNKICKFSFQGRCDQVNDKIISILSNSNFKTIFLGIETYSENLLKKINKKLNTEQIRNAINICKNNGMNVQASFIYGFPEETIDDRFKTLKFALDHDIDIAKFNNLVPYPGTHLFKKYNKYVNFSPDYYNADTLIPLTKGLFSRINLPFKTSDYEEKRILRFIYLSYFVFYFRTKSLKNILYDSKNSIKWIYFWNYSNIFSFVFLVISITIKFLTIFLYPSKENIFYWIFKRKNVRNGKI